METLEELVIKYEQEVRDLKEQVMRPTIAPQIGQIFQAQIVAYENMLEDVNEIRAKNRYEI